MAYYTLISSICNESVTLYFLILVQVTIGKLIFTVECLLYNMLNYRMNVYKLVINLSW